LLALLLLDLPAVSGTIITTGSPQSGSVLQVVSATTSTQVSVSGGTYTDTTLTATITPKFSTSKILVLVNQPARVLPQATTSAVFAGIQLVRNSTAILIPVSDGAGPYQLGFASTSTNQPGFRIGWNVSYLDSPATTSATTYKTQAKRYDSTSTIIVQENDTSARLKNLPPIMYLKANHCKIVDVASNLI
jgi:hypothetical protein